MKTYEMDILEIIDSRSISVALNLLILLNELVSIHYKCIFALWTN